MNLRTTPLGDTAVVLTFEGSLDEALLARVRSVADAIERDRPEGVTEVVPAFATMTAFYDPVRIEGFTALCAALRARAGQVESTLSRSPGRVLEIPVCYGGEFGPDLGDVAARGGSTPEEVVAMHSGGHYFVQAIGFSPGFAYLGGLPEELHTPRRATPRTQVPAGAVGIGGALTGVYPLASPGGWNLIGRTPLKMFDPTRREPALLRAGDRVRFRAIMPEEFAAWK